METLEAPGDLCGSWGILEAPGDLAVGYRWGGVMGDSGSTWGFGCRV